MYRLKRRFSITPERMAEAYVRLALAPEFTAITGTHFDEHCRAVAIPAGAQKAETRNRLWHISERLTRASVG